MDTDEGALVSVLIPTSDGKFGNYHLGSGQVGADCAELLRPG